MSIHAHRNPRLRDRDFEILEHVMRYRLSTPEVLHALFFPDLERNAVTKVTSRLCDHQFLAAHPLYDRNTYFTLGRLGAKAMGISPSKVGPLGSQSRYREFGTLMFCCRSKEHRQRFRFAEFQQNYPALILGKLDAAHYYLDRHVDAQGLAVVRLGFIWVDGAGPVDNIVRTIRQDIIAPRRELPEFRKLIDNGRFLIAVVTLTDPKANEISHALNKLNDPVAFRVEVVPELVHLLAGLGHA